ncbi:MAG: ATP-binding cassette domain-containing protein [Edaphobacter sp.]|uniref:ATP-binding cassette domain-containing protein n=1 Tax=Edaphobacter sp. TaxID=1934404 RepID=UPI00239B5B44|nr:ATP-binding cassette domain-containing protein [Edaphobacter sp.]MDE1175076.1 ATP-binding cassette domain-containing protein [Edaphobacter sp.]
MSDSLLTVSIRHAVGTVALDISFRLTQPWTVLFGPSGSGKTTVLRSIGGFLRPDNGRIASGDDVFLDTAEKIFVPPFRRRVRSSGQMERLFPNMTVMQNILYGSGDAPHNKAESIAREVMASFLIDHLEKRRPQELSGGERQRTAVARALVAAISLQGEHRPLLLLDEPLSGLDLKVRDLTLTALRKWTSKCAIPVLSVTHSLGEAFQLEAEILRLADGRIVQQGPAVTVLEEERQHLMRQLGAR